MNSTQLSILINHGPRASVGVGRTTVVRSKHQVALQCVLRGGFFWSLVKMKKGVGNGRPACLYFIYFSPLKILLEERELCFKSLKIIALGTGSLLLEFLQKGLRPAVGKTPPGCHLPWYPWDLIYKIPAHLLGKAIVKMWCPKCMVCTEVHR